MDAAQALWSAIREAWVTLLPGPWERNFVKGAVLFAFSFSAVWAIEKAYRARTRNYRTRDFAHDTAYYFYYRSGIQRLLVTGPLFLALDAPLSFLDLRLLDGLPVAAKIVLGIVIGDFVMYWLHRAQHAFPFLWAFHTTHHSTEHLTFAAYLRFHPIEVFVGEVLAFVLLRLLGFDIGTWLAVYLVTNFLGEIQHSQIPWRLGPFYKVIVTPTFHAYHHSPDRALHDRNFGGLLAVWDYLFGTAVDARTPRPATFGLPHVKPRSLWSTFADPFRLLREFYSRDRRGPILVEDESRAR